MRIQSGEYEDWRGKKADSKKQGGIKAAIFACGNVIKL